MIYLDNAATTPVLPEVREAMLPYLRTEFGNPASVHGLGIAARDAVENARARVATVLGMRPGDVIFTSGGTEANNLAIKGIGIAAQQRTGARHVVSTPIEHESVLQSIDYLQRVHGFTATLLPVDGCGRVDPEDVRAAITAETAVVSVGYANNEIGTIQDVHAIAAATGVVPFHTDAVQAAGWLPLLREAVGADAISLAGHKVGAPKGTGVLGVRGRIPLEPLLHGGGQQRGKRSGTEDVAGAVGLATALEFAQVRRAERAAHVQAARDRLIAAVLTQIPGAELTGDAELRLPGTASFVLTGVSGESVLIELERRGVISSSGSACAAGSSEPSHVLIALGLTAEKAQTAVRFTFSALSAPPPDQVVDQIAQAIADSAAANTP